MDKNAYKNWMKKNPLYQFRQENDLNRSTVAVYLGVAASTVQFWENGGNYPNEENIAKIADMLEISQDKLENRWEEWENKQPILS